MTITKSIRSRQVAHSARWVVTATRHVTAAMNNALCATFSFLLYRHTPKDRRTDGQTGHNHKWYVIKERARSNSMNVWYLG